MEFANLIESRGWSSALHVRSLLIGELKKINIQIINKTTCIQISQKKNAIDEVKLFIWLLQNCDIYLKNLIALVQGGKRLHSTFHIS